MAVPVLKKVCAGSWLICSVCMDLMTHNSSAHLTQMWEDARHLDAALTVFGKRMLGAKHLERLILQLSNGLPLGQRLGHGLPVQACQLGLVVECLQMAWSAGHTQVNNSPDARWMMHADFSLGICAIQQGCERDRSQAAASEKGAAGGSRAVVLQIKGPGRAGGGRHGGYGSAKVVNNEWSFLAG